MTFIKYRIKCLTEDEEFIIYLPESESAPTECPNNSEHNVDIVILEKYERLLQTTSTGIPIIETRITSGIFGEMSITLTTHDFGDPTTWYQNSLKMTEETLIDSGDHKTYNYTGVNKPWINPWSNRLMGRENYYQDINGTFRDKDYWDYTVYIDSVASSKDDYTIDFGWDYINNIKKDNCSITFNNALTGTEVVTITIWYVNPTHGSLWQLKPCSTGREVFINNSETQFSLNLQLENITEIIFEVWGGSTQSTYDALWGQKHAYCPFRTKWRGIRDFINDANSGYYIPACGNNELQDGIMIFPFNYCQAILLQKTETAETIMRIYLKDDVPVKGSEISTATFWCIGREISG